MKIGELGELTMIMTYEEATWLKSVFQNPIGGKDLEDEDALDTKMRSMFWNLLDNEGIK